MGPGPRSVTIAAVILEASEPVADRGGPVGGILRWASDRAGAVVAFVEFLGAHLVGLIRLVRERRPEVWRRFRRLCLISDYLTLWLTGCHATEAGAAGLTGLVDVHRLEWRPVACERLGLDREWLTVVVHAGA